MTRSFELPMAALLTLDDDEVRASGASIVDVGRHEDGRVTFTLEVADHRQGEVAALMRRIRGAA